MAHLTLLESTVDFVLLIGGIYAFLWGLWFLGVRFVPARPFISLVRQRKHDRPKDRGSSSLNEYLKHRRDAQASDAPPVARSWLCVSTARAGLENRSAQSAAPKCARKAGFGVGNFKTLPGLGSGDTAQGTLLPLHRERQRLYLRGCIQGQIGEPICAHDEQSRSANQVDRSAHTASPVLPTLVAAMVSYKSRLGSQIFSVTFICSIL